MRLPQGWSRASITQVAKLIRGVTYDKALACNMESRDAVAIARATNIQEGTLTKKELVYVPKHFVNSEQMLQSGDIVVATSSGSRTVVGKAAQADVSHMGMSFGAFCGLVRPQDSGLSPWLARVFQTPEYRAFVEAVAIGTNINNLRTRDLAGYEIPIPPELEQGRILHKLGTLTGRIQGARIDLNRTQALTARLRQQVLSDAYVAAANAAGVEPIEFFIGLLDQGWSPKCENYPSQSVEEWAVLKTTAIQALRFQGHENKVLPGHLRPRPRLEITAGDILVTRAGPRVRVGISCAVGQTRPKLILADKIYRLRCDPRRSVPDYLAFMLNSPQILERIEAMKTGISDSGLNLTQEKFLSLPVPKIGVDEQQDLVRRVSGHFVRVGRLEAEAARARVLLDRLEAAILAKAFRGELVPQDPDDEPASVLLERIRARRAAAPKAKRGRGARVAADA